MPRPKDLLRLNLGCGLQVADEWVNVDGSWNARLARYPALRRLLSSLHIIARDKSEIPWDSKIFIHDIRKPLPFPDDSVSAVYASHVLEHLYVEEGRSLIRESFRVLASSGILRVVVPDLNAIVREYLGERPFGQLSDDLASLNPADRLNQRLLMRWPTPGKNGLLYRIYSSWQDFHSHKWMYDTDSLVALFQTEGFVEVQSKDCHNSRIDDIGKVENPSRILNGGGICVEGVKPPSQPVA
ncbi:MAG TPA: methyltransferase domain-containing protein [Candidatus Acidoferrales bacterium]|nr:methyltransferase domain-containing protein [Candidatus Acidoferrales bacterium]